MRYNHHCANRHAAAELIAADGRVFVFLYLCAGAVQFGLDCGARIGDLVFERFSPAEGNQGRNNHDFSQESHNV
jgi:hypothetical protein